MNENEKFYKVGFIDGINLIIECIGGKLRCWVNMEFYIVNI